MRVAVIGDYMVDIDTFFTQVKIAPDCHVPVCVLQNESDEIVRPGGAGAVVEMLKGFGTDVIAIGENVKQKCTKHRFFVNGKPCIRKDTDFTDPISISDVDTLIEQIPSDVEYIIVSDYGKGVITDNMWYQLALLGKKLIVDPAINKCLLWYYNAYAMVPNAKEANVTYPENAFVRAEWLVNYYPNVCIKLGHYGMISKCHNKAAIHFEAELITPVDVCGAGDMVIAAITSSLIRGCDWHSACEFANKMAARKCMQLGATPVSCPIKGIMIDEEHQFRL